MLIYIAGCYSATKGRSVQEHIDVAKEASIEVWKTGNFALCPHLNTSHFGDVLPNADYYGGTLEMLRRCDAILMLENWQDSRGAMEELAYAEKTGMPIFYYPALPAAIHLTEQRCPKQCHAFMDTVMTMYRTHLAKNADYSPANILVTGEIGLATRLWDKVARILNLYGFNIQAEKGILTQPRSPKNESLDDSFLDLAVYAIIGMLLRQDRWGR